MINVDFAVSRMAAKAYVVSMTVSELKEELKQRGLSTKGSKKDLRDRLEQALYDEELDDPESEPESDTTPSYNTGMVQGGFNFEVPPESFIAEEDILADVDDVESMIVSVQLSDRERLEVHPCGNATSRMGVGVGDRLIGDASLGPMIVAIELGNNSVGHEESYAGIPDRQFDRTLDPVLVSDPVKEQPRPQEQAQGVNGQARTNTETTNQIAPQEASTERSLPSDESHTPTNLSRPPQHDHTPSYKSSSEAVLKETTPTEPPPITEKTTPTPQPSAGDQAMPIPQPSFTDNPAESTNSLGTDQVVQRLSAQTSVSEPSEQTPSGGPSEQTPSEGLSSRVEGQCDSPRQAEGEGLLMKGVVSAQEDNPPPTLEAANDDNKAKEQLERAAQEGTGKQVTEEAANNKVDELPMEVCEEGPQVSAPRNSELEVANNETNEVPTLETANKETDDPPSQYVESEPVVEAVNNETDELVEATNNKVSLEEIRNDESDVLVTHTKVKEAANNDTNDVCTEEIVNKVNDNTQQKEATNEASDEPTKEATNNASDEPTKEATNEASDEPTEKALPADLPNSVEEATKDNPILKEVTQDNAGSEEVTQDDVISEEVTQDDVITVEAAKDNVITEKTTQGDISSEEATKNNINVKEDEIYLEEETKNESDTAVELMDTKPTSEQSGGQALEGEKQPPVQALVEEQKVSQSKEGDHQVEEQSVHQADQTKEQFVSLAEGSQALEEEEQSVSQAKREEPSQVDMEFSVHAEVDEFSEFTDPSLESRSKASRKSHDRSRESHDRSRESHDKSRESHDRSRESHDKSRESHDRSRESYDQTRGKRERRDSKSEHYEPTPIKKRRISTNAPVTTPTDRKRRWGSGRQRSESGPPPAINSDLIEDIIPVEVSQMAELGQLDDVLREPGEGGDVSEPGEGRDVSDPGEGGGVGGEPSDTNKTKEAEKERQELETRQRIEARLRAKREAEVNAKRLAQRRRTPSPPRHTPTRILHVEGLTRPFTKEELRELLSVDGPYLDEAFWIDKIRSHCIAVYDTQEVAISTRQRIHGIKWPLTSPKFLSADFLTANHVSTITDGQLVIEEEGDMEQDEQLPESSPPADPEPPQPPVAMDTTEESAPIKPTMLLDELFRKTKATPSIYWLPLTEAQVLEREAKEKQEEEEREKKREERRKAWMAQRELEDKERNKRLQEERERRARDRVRRRSRSRSRDRQRR